MNKIPDKSERLPYSKYRYFKCHYHYHHSCVNHWIKMMTSPITKYCLYDIEVPDCITSIDNYEWQYNRSKLPVKSIESSDIMENTVQANDNVNYFQLRKNVILN